MSATKKQGQQRSRKSPSSQQLEARHSGQIDARSPPDPSPDESGTEDSFPIVALGASAGGLSALRQLFAQVPPNPGLAFVVVMHLSPDHESHLEVLLQPHISMPVLQVTETVKLEPDHVYVIPPNANLDTIDTHLRLSELEARRQERAPIDHFLRTLASTHTRNAIAVILTGTGSDGTLGLRQIKEGGGLTIVQDPAEAEYDGMPRSAISGAPVDLILPLAEIPAAILRFVRTKPRLPFRDGQLEDPQILQFLQTVCVQVRTRTGREFAHYKRSTLLRRISRRMQFNHVQEPGDYIELLRKQPEEVNALADDILITVTSFFRDPEVFEVVEREIVPLLFAGKGPEDSVRAWSVGCATGEEAYSLAILLMEEAARHARPPAIQVFASDLHNPSLVKAREGFYPGDIQTDISAERLKRYFERENGGYRVRQEVREAVIFAPHNLLADPPFSKLDLVSCRNLLIYLNRDLHRQVAELFHYALLPDGVLVLGSSENVDAPELFRLEDKKRGIYRKRNVPGPEPRLPVFPVTRGRLPRGRPSEEVGKEPPAYAAVFHRLMEHQGPPVVLVSPEDNVVYSSSGVGSYLIHPSGPPTASLFKLAREEIRIELRSAMDSARREGKPVRTKPVPLRLDGSSSQLVLDVRPARDPEQEGFVLLLFEERPAEPRPAPSEPVSAQDLTRLERLELEKRQSEQRLQRLIEEHETSQEEIRASNEELQSANEELRSTLEELETSKEELQSINEELHTVNQENRHKVEELDQLSSDLQNLLVATDIATLFLDRDLRILRFTPSVENLFSVRMTDRGRRLSDFSSHIGYDALAADAGAVLERLLPVEREVRDEAGRWYLTRILPYRSVQDRILGVVVTFVDITRLKHAEEAVRQAKESSERIIENLPQPLLVLNADLRVHSANAAFLDLFKVQADETIGHRVYELGNGQWDIVELRGLLEKILPENKTFSGYEVIHDFPRLGRRVMLLNARQLEDMGLILLGIEDVTERQRAVHAMRESEQRFRALVMASSEVLYRMSPDWTEMRQLHSRGFLSEAQEPTRAWLDEYVPKDEQQRLADRIQEAVRTRSVFELEHRVRRADGSVGWVLSRAVPILDGDGAGEIVEWFGTATDVTERRAAEEQLREGDRRKDEYLAMLGHELRNPLGAMRSAAELLPHVDTQDPQLLRIYGVLDRQSSHMSRIIDGLLDISRIARGKINLEIEAIDLRGVVERVLEIQGPQIAARGLELATDIAPEPIWIQGDDARLSQILDNLFSNAIKFTPAPGTITVALSRDATSAVLRVRDTGIGIRRELLSSIFESFQQEAQDVARTSGGLGLGLALARGLVELHGGSIEASSDGPGMGAEFVIRLPTAAAPIDGAKQEQNERGPVRRILLVEDNVDAAEMLRDLLQISGHGVTLVQRGDEALSALRQTEIDLVICDLGLPGLSGLELAREIRKDPALRHLPLVALSGYAQPEDRKQTTEAGFDEHLVKPVNVALLERVLARLGAGGPPDAGRDLA